MPRVAAPPGVIDHQKVDRGRERYRIGVVGVADARARRTRGVGDLHAEGQRAVRDRLPDAPHADHAEPARP